jgi:hypothetical protein
MLAIAEYLKLVFGIRASWLGAFDHMSHQDQRGGLSKPFEWHGDLAGLEEHQIDMRHIEI